MKRGQKMNDQQLLILENNHKMLESISVNAMTQSAKNKLFDYFIPEMIVQGYDDSKINLLRESIQKELNNVWIEYENQAKLANDIYKQSTSTNINIYRETLPKELSAAEITINRFAKTLHPITKIALEKKNIKNSIYFSDIQKLEKKLYGTMQSRMDVDHPGNPYLSAVLSDYEKNTTENKQPIAQLFESNHLVETRRRPIESPMGILKFTAQPSEKLVASANNLYENIKLSVYKELLGDEKSPETAQELLNKYKKEFVDNNKKREQFMNNFSGYNYLQEQTFFDKNAFLDSLPNFHINMDKLSITFSKEFRNAARLGLSVATDKPMVDRLTNLVQKHTDLGNEKKLPLNSFEKSVGEKTLVELAKLTDRIKQLSHNKNKQKLPLFNLTQSAKRKSNTQNLTSSRSEKTKREPIIK